MIVECPKCKKKYRVKDEEIPVGGAPVRCPSCGNVFTIYREPLDIHLEPIAPEPQKPFATGKPSIQEPVKPTAPSRPAPSGESFLEGIEKTLETPVSTPTEEKPASPTFEKPAAPTFEKPAAPTFEQPTPPVQEKPTPQPPSPPSSTVDAAARLKAALGLGGVSDFPADWPEEKKQKHRHAKRLARSLAKDLLLYHKDKIEQGLRDGTLKQILKEEIKKSWDFYKSNVDPEVLQSANYFKDALNEIIGKGRTIFI